MKTSLINTTTKKIVLASSLGFVTLLWAGCEKDYYYTKPATDPEPVTTPVSYASEIQPIFNASCNMASCHDGTHEPNLLAGSSYSSVLGFINTANPEASELYRRITLPDSDPEFMPEGEPALSSEEINKILSWITQGAQNN